MRAGAHMGLLWRLYIFLQAVSLFSDCLHASTPPSCRPRSSTSLMAFFLFAVPVFSSSLASSHPPVPTAAAAALPLCRAVRAGARLSAILGQTGGPTQQQVGTIVRVLGEEKRGRKANNGRDAGGGLMIQLKEG